MYPLQPRERKGVQKIVTWTVIAIGGAVLVMIAAFIILQLLGEASITASGGT